MILTKHFMMTARQECTDRPRSLRFYFKPPIPPRLPQCHSATVLQCYCCSATVLFEASHLGCPSSCLVSHPTTMPDYHSSGVPQSHSATLPQCQSSKVPLCSSTHNSAAPSHDNAWLPQWCATVPQCNDDAWLPQYHSATVL